MPELPEVETTKRGIEKAVVNKRIKNVIIRQPKLRYPIPKAIQTALVGCQFDGVERRSKYLLFSSKQGTLLLHLGMSGSLRLVKPDEPIKKHDHVDFVFDDLCLRYSDPRRFGMLLWTEVDPGEHKLLKNLGPEPLTKAFNANMLFELSRRRTVNIKTFIMNSQVVVGVGNIYASESLYLAGIHPESAANKISLARCENLVAAIKQVLKKAIKAGGTTLKDFKQSDGKPGYFKQELQVYGREGEPCYKCNSPIKKVVIGQRSSYFCFKCQKSFV